MAISTAEFRNGMCIEYNNKLWVILEFQHVKPGKGGVAFVRTKLRDIRAGRVVEHTFNAGTKVESLRLEKKKMQYLLQRWYGFLFHGHHFLWSKFLSPPILWVMLPSGLRKAMK